MGLDLGSAVNRAADWLCGAPIVGAVVGNPIFTALLIVALGAIIVMALYHYQIKQAGLKRGVRALVYGFFAVLAVVFVHHYAVMRSARLAAAQRGVREVFSGIEQSRTGGLGGVPVVPMGFEGRARPAPPQPLLAVAPGGPEVTGGDRGRPAAGARPDNVAVGDLVIRDVVVPSASPFGGPAR